MLLSAVGANIMWILRFSLCVQTTSIRY